MEALAVAAYLWFNYKVFQSMTSEQRTIYRYHRSPGTQGAPDGGEWQSVYTKEGRQ